MAEGCGNDGRGAESDMRVVGMTAEGQEENDVVDRGTMAGGHRNDGRGWERCGGLPGMGVGGAHPSPD